MQTAKLYVDRGQLVEAFTFTADELTAESMASALSKINRFSGNGAFAYSVAQHSTTLSYMVPKKLAKAALLHDVPEMFIGDIPNPIKILSPEIMKIEDRILKQVSRVFRVPIAHFLEIRSFDSRIARDEAAALFPDAVIPTEARLGIEIREQPAREAARDWVSRFYELFMGENHVD